MAYQLHKLSAKKVENLKKRPLEGRYGDGGNLILRITKTGASGWVFRFMIPGTGKITEHGLGSLKEVSLAEARERAAQCRRSLAAGIDPRTAPEEEQGTAMTFGQVADEFFQKEQNRWSNGKARYKWERALTVHCAPIRSIQVAEIDTQHVLQVLTPIWDKTNHTATRLRSQLEEVLDYAEAMRYRTGRNPARLKGHLQHILPSQGKHKVQHQKALPYREIPAFVKALRERDALSAMVLEFLILTAKRSSEVRLATWAEIDLDAGLWTIPAERTKTRETHEEPLSDRAVAILRKLQEVRYCDYVFPGQRHGRPLSDQVFKKLFDRMKATDITAHGFRSSFRDWAGDETDFGWEIAEAALSHKVGNKVEQAYRRGKALEKRRRLMAEWADYCSGASADNVVQLQA